MAVGKRNRENAKELVNIQGTVEIHANHLLCKVGFRSRYQVAAWLASHR